MLRDDVSYSYNSTHIPHSFGRRERTTQSKEMRYVVWCPIPHGMTFHVVEVALGYRVSLGTATVLQDLQFARLILQTHLLHLTVWSLQTSIGYELGSS